MLLRNRESWQDNIGAFFPSTEVFAKNTCRQLDNGLFVWSAMVAETLANLARILGNRMQIPSNLQLQRGNVRWSAIEMASVPAVKACVTRQ
jgi:hypothetical protein